MRRAPLSLFLVFALTGCKTTQPTAVKKPSGARPPSFNSPTFSKAVLDAARANRPAPSTPQQKQAAFVQIFHKPFPVFRDGGGGQGQSWNLTVASPSAEPNDGSYYLDTFLIFEDASEVWTHPGDYVAMLEVNQNPWIMVETQGSPNKSTFLDCSIGEVSPPDANAQFQFDAALPIDAPFTNASIVTPSQGHVYYGLAPVPLASDGVTPYIQIRLRPAPNSKFTSFNFYGCEFSYVN